MATFVLAATATPARVIGCRQDCRRLIGGWVIHDYKAIGSKGEYAESALGECRARLKEHSIFDANSDPTYFSQAIPSLSRSLAEFSA
jgi:hypothetical protein